MLRRWWLRWVVLRAALLAWVLVRRIPLPRLVERFARTGGGRLRLDAADLAVAAGYIDRILRSLPYPVDGRCLPRAFALYRLGAGSGLPVRLHCGLRRSGDGMRGHAWVTIAGRPVAERHDGAFGETFAYPAADGT